MVLSDGGSLKLTPFHLHCNLLVVVFHKKAHTQTKQADKPVLFVSYHSSHMYNGNRK